MSWTDERVEQLKKLWAEGLSASQIAAQIGGVSRNAVIGKVHRLNLPGRAKSGAARRPRNKRVNTASNRTAFNNPRSASPSHRNSAIHSSASTATALKAEAYTDPDIIMRPVEDVVVPISKKLSLVELNEQTCKWPVGDPMSEDFYFCGNEADETTPYCSYHAKIAYNSLAERRRNDSGNSNNSV